MEVANIDWKNIDSRFVKDELYEHMNAPKWVDFSAPDEPINDEAWFCRPSCNHAKTAEDFFNGKERKTPPSSNSKLQRSASESNTPPLDVRIKRDATLKKRGINQPFALSLNKDTKQCRVIEDGENQNPNFSTPVIHKRKVGKEAIKSSTEKKPINDTIMNKNERTPQLRNTLSARNLFSGGGDILNKVAEFCNDLKKLAIRARDRENNAENNARDRVNEIIDVLKNDKEKERKPLLEMSKEKSEVMGTSGGSKGQLRRKKRNEDEENIPISVDMKNIKHQESERSLQIRTYPPTPQCFSTGQGHSKAPTPKPFRIRPLNHQERGGIVHEVKEMNKVAAAAEKDAKSLDVFWFLKPCTLSS